MSDEELIDYFKSKDMNNLFVGFLNDKIAEYIGKTSNLDDLNDLAYHIKNLSFDIIGQYSLKDAQVCSGGVNLDEVNDSLELKKYSNIYVGGELLNIDGVSGGYNLQFAWSSAGVISKDILKKEGI